MPFKEFKRLFTTETLIISVVCSFLSLGVFASSTSAAPIRVNIDEAKIVELNRPINQVIIGNPSIADVTVQSRSILVFTGKSTGHTNIILLDENNRQILNEKVHVSTSNESGMVVVHRGSARSSYHCGTICNGRVALGDHHKYTANVLANTDAKLGFTSRIIKGD